MEEKNFILQHRFEIRPFANSITDTMIQRDVKVEPRVMKLLCMLAKQPGQLVKREYLITEIWNDYGGGEAGLNHAVSTLRKLLDDTSKELIETIPTKGYILHAEINEAERRKEPEPKRFSKRLLVYGCFILVAAIAVYLLWPSQPASKDMTVPFAEVNKQTEETWLNTIVTFGSDSTEYKLKVIGDSRPEFFINGRLLSPDEMEKHLPLINNLKQRLGERAR